jgi:hypothetical protein
VSIQLSRLLNTIYSGRHKRISYDIYMYHVLASRIPNYENYIQTTYHIWVLNPEWDQFHCSMAGAPKATVLVYFGDHEISIKVLDYSKNYLVWLLFECIACRKCYICCLFYEISFNINWDIKDFVSQIMRLNTVQWRTSSRIQCPNMLIYSWHQKRWMANQIWTI